MPNWSDDEGRCHFEVNGVPCYQSALDKCLAHARHAAGGGGRMTGCDCGGNTHNEEHANDCAGWRLEVERLREALRDVAERQREACAIYLAKVCNDYGMQPDCLCSPADEVLRATPLVTGTE